MTTVSPVGEYATGFMARLRARCAADARHAEALRASAADAARQIAGRFGARRVWLFGSLAWGVADCSSDVDLLIEGLPSAAWDAATRAAEETIAVPVDVIRVEEAAPGLLARVQADGILLHDSG